MMDERDYDGPTEDESEAGGYHGKMMMLLS